jgi:ATP-dependent helicase/nuclease subunit A
MNVGLSARVRATTAQLQASDPKTSSFVAASAGSGKTKLLTDRLLRLMLGGADPARIQCLTFTKAAAAEMAIRLNTTLGKWVTLDDAALDEALSELGMIPDAELRQESRALFAKVLDLPGGMRIGTIHAFCQSLLRRFPLEAQISPHFQLVEDRDADDALTEAREDMLARAHPADAQAALALLAGLCSLAGFGKLVDALRADRQRLAGLSRIGADGLPAALMRAVGLEASDDRDAIIGRAVMWREEAVLRRAAQMVQQRGAATCAEKSRKLLEFLSLEADERVEHWQTWRDEFLLGDGKPRGPSVFVNKKLCEQDPELQPVFLAEQDRVRQVEDQLRALELARISAALVTLATPVIGAYATHKEAAGLLDYDDLIHRTSKLLVDPGAAWVLYKLDGGLDHLLLDEVQDTAPAQWRIAAKLTEEFFAGSGARDIERTVFAVGDRKQSIYSVQGADAYLFERERAALAGVVGSAGKAWRDVALDVSFRSTAPVLSLVDAVFADPIAAQGVVVPGETLTHYADRAAFAGSVELWPLAPAPPAQDPAPWNVAEHNAAAPSARQNLAAALAEWIARQTDGSVPLESRGRPLAAGDMLVLVRRRDELSRALVRALKQRGVAVAGLDRMVLTEQPAVQDLLALADTLLLPEDDLALACVLTSPLGFLSDDSLMALAVGRRASLWEALRARADERPDWLAAHGFIAAMLGRVDYVSPYALLAEALGPLGGRARLFARLGPEAAEPVDELLNAALSYGRSHPPSLQGFLHWLRRSGAEIKRQAEAAGNAVRVMTVHGAKGLQAPVVILPDTTALPPDDGAVLWGTDPLTGTDLPLWAPRKEFRSAVCEQLRAAAAERRMAEHNRLLYVALTRAEDRLVVCGWQPTKPLAETSWYAMVARGFAALPATAENFSAWDGEKLRLASPQTAKLPEPPLPATGQRAAPPDWMGRAPGWQPRPPPAEPARPEHLAPSRPEGAGLGAVPGAASPLGERDTEGKRFRRGQLIHALLQHLPAIPPADRPAAAQAWLDRPGNSLGSGAAAEIAAEVLAILDHPELAPLFGLGSRAEVPLTGLVAGPGETLSVVGGLVDRLAVLDHAVLLADYKTNRDPPKSVGETPVLYLRQLAAYRAVLRQIFPDKAVRCALVWTRTAQVVMLPDPLLDAHQPSAAIPPA